MEGRKLINIIIVVDELRRVEATGDRQSWLDDCRAEETEKQTLLLIDEL